MTIPHPTHPFLGLPLPKKTAPTVVVLPLPLELTASYGRGTAAGPAAVIDATEQCELWDHELGFTFEPALGLSTAPSWEPPQRMEPAEAIVSIRRYLREHMKTGALAVGVGGEHTVTIALLAEILELHGPVTVVQIDAHCDLRDTYEGTPLSHACVARRGLEMGHGFVQLGVRAMSRQEWDLGQASGSLSLYPAANLHADPAFFEQALAEIRATQGHLYFSLDVDGLDPSIVPGTGTPVPNGLDWEQATRIIDATFGTGRVVGMDLVETAPIPGQQVSEFAAARLLQRCVARYLQSRPPANPPEPSPR